MTPDETFAVARKNLHLSARAYATDSSGPAGAQLWEALCVSALAFAKAHWAIKAPPDTSDLVRVPFGRDKGKLLSELDDRSVKWLSGVCAENVNDPTKSKYRAQNEVLSAAVQREAERRGL